MKQLTVSMFQQLHLFFVVAVFSKFTPFFLLLLSLWFLLSLLFPFPFLFSSCLLSPFVGLTEQYPLIVHDLQDVLCEDQLQKSKTQQCYQIYNCRDIFCGQLKNHNENLKKRAKKILKQAPAGQKRKKNYTVFVKKLKILLEGGIS